MTVIFFLYSAKFRKHGPSRSYSRGRGRMRLPSGVRSAGHGSAGLSPLQWHCRLDASWNSRAAWMALDVNFLLGRGWKGHRNQKQGPVNIRWIALLSYSMSN